jgi:hypothetical protein
LKQFFKDHYSAFFLISKNAPNEDRKAYLQNEHNDTVDEFDELANASINVQVSDPSGTNPSVYRVTIVKLDGD